MVQLLSKPTSKTLRTEVMAILHDAIVRGQLKPGDHLKESEIAKQLSVSRSPVREALRQLEQEGLVVSVPNQGSYVKTYTHKEIDEIFTLRSALENLACELIIQGNKLSSLDWKRLDRYVEEQRTAIDAQAFDELTELDMDFHEFICKKSGSERLLTMWQSLRGQIQVLFYQRFRVFEQVPQTVDVDHMAILDALRLADIEETTKLNKQINARVAQECIDIFVANGE